MAYEHAFRQQQFESMAAAVAERVALHRDHDVRVRGNVLHRLLEAQQSTMDHFPHRSITLIFIRPLLRTLLNIFHDDADHLHSRNDEGTEGQRSEMKPKSTTARAYDGTLETLAIAAFGGVFWITRRPCEIPIRDGASDNADADRGNELVGHQPRKSVESDHEVVKFK